MQFEGGKRFRQTDTKLLLFGPMLLFKLACDLGYWYLLSWNTTVFHAEFNPLKFIVSLIWCIVLYFGIDHDSKKASAFLLYLFFLLQIIPITTIYALGNDNSVYYFSICLTVLLCEMIVRYLDNDTKFIRDETLSLAMTAAYVILCAFTIVRLIRIFGMPSSTALNIYNVYEMRANAQMLGKLLNYLLEWTTAVFLPFWMAKAVTDRKYLTVAALCGMMLLIYLYTGHKTYLFAIPVVIGCSIWARREECHKELFFCFCIGFSVLVLLCFAEPDRNRGIFNQIFSLLGRRCMLDSANNKFKYYDYFHQRPMMGFYGVLPRWLIPFKSYYENIPFTYEISRIYFNAPEMNSNTGFLAEGYMRFGHPGTLVVMLLFSVILKMVDRFAERTSYQFAVGLFAFPVFSLADAHLISSLFFGPWMLLFLILCFYKKSEKSVLPMRVFPNSGVRRDVNGKI